MTCCKLLNLTSSIFLLFLSAPLSSYAGEWHKKCNENLQCGDYEGPGTDECQSDDDCGADRCTGYTCQRVPPVEGKDSTCLGDDDCDTECNIDGTGTGNFHDQDSCGECTFDGCSGKDPGDKCKITSAGGKKIRGLCVSDGNCNDGGGGFAGACGKQCSCVLESAVEEIMFIEYFHLNLP
ncbi:MAG: hypothetical protein H6619_03425 [Deltaproteobacteria bacterium]|nr:hypothetical protein [Deltaproteobacteria bacterium]